MVNIVDVTCEYKGTSQDKEVIWVNTTNACTADAKEVKSNHGNCYGNPCEKTCFLFQEDSHNRNQHDVESCYEAGLTSGCMKHTQLLQVSCDCKDYTTRNSVKDRTLIKLVQFICRCTFIMLPENLLIMEVLEDDKWNQNECTQRHSEDCKCKWSDRLKALTLCYKTGTPDDSSEQEKE